VLPPFPAFSAHLYMPRPVLRFSRTAANHMSEHPAAKDLRALAVEDDGAVTITQECRSGRDPQPVHVSFINIK
jgi:hypothetical protein